jgi:hypothetical protein
MTTHIIINFSPNLIKGMILVSFTAVFEQQKTKDVLIRKNRLILHYQRPFNL